MKSLRICFVVVCCFSPFSVFAFGNEDVIQLLSAGFGEEVILNAIATSNPATFDTSASGLIALKKKGASTAVIQKVLARQGENRLTDRLKSSIAADGSCILEAPGKDEFVLIRAEGKMLSLRPQRPEMIGTEDIARAIGSLFTAGIIEERAKNSRSVKGERALVRTTEKMPEIVDIMIPFGSYPEDMIILVRMSVEKSKRTVQVWSQERGITGTYERLDFGENVRVPLVMEKVANQCTWGGKQVAQYKMKPAAPLESGEYGILTGDVIFDFGID